MQSAQTDYLTTVAYEPLPRISPPEIFAPTNLLYFRFVLKFDGAVLNETEHLKLKKCLRGAIEDFGGKAVAVAVNKNRVYLLIGLPPVLGFADFIERLRIFSKFTARRKLDIEKFVWQEKYEVSTVGFSELETIILGIRRQDYLTPTLALRRKFVSLEMIN